MRVKLYTLLATLFFIANLFAETIRITNGEWEPFLSNYSFQYGFNSHVVTEAFKLEGITVEWGFFPWQRAYENAKSGSHWDASCCWWPDDEINKEFVLSDTITNTSFVFFHLKSYNFQWHSLQDLKGIKIGGTSKYDYGKAFNDATAAKKITVDFAAKDEFNYKKLLAGRIQVFPNDPAVGHAQIKNVLSPEEAKLLTYHPKQFGESSLHLIINAKNKRSKYLLDKFNAGLEKLKLNGQYQQMLRDLESGKYDKKKIKQ